MALRTNGKNESGYTLVETLVAMAIFVSVLIPLGATIGNFILNRSSEKLQQALHVAETEMSRAVMSGSYSDATNEDSETGFIARREVESANDTRDVTVSVSEIRNPDKILVVLHKTFFDYGNLK